MFKQITKEWCPLLNQRCVEDNCKFWVHLIGRNPNNGQPVDNFNCSIAWLPLLLTEVTGTTNQVAAAVESLRNETVNHQNTALSLAVAVVKESRNGIQSSGYTRSITNQHYVEQVDD